MNEIISELEKISRDARSTFGGFSREQINWRPSAEVWSVGQCFDHLIVTNKLYFPIVRRVAGGRHRNNFFSKIPFSTDLIGALMKSSLNPDQKRKMKTFKVFEPAASGVAETVIEDFAANQRELIELIEAVKDFDLRAIKIPEPLSPALNLRLDDAFEILAMHEKRHFRQAERLINEKNFPGANMIL